MSALPLEVGSGAGVVGVGVDLVDVAAFAAQLDEPGTRFAEVFTPGERRYAGRTGDPGRRAESLAARWAAKEAVLKAWSGTVWGDPDTVAPERVDLRDIEVVTDAWDRPRIRLRGTVAAALAGCTAHLSLSHDGGLATAYVVLTREVGV